MYLNENIMEDILKSDIPLTSKNFWYGVGAKIQKSVKGVVQVFFKFNNSVVIKIFFESINYSINTEFPCKSSIDERFIIDEVLNSIYSNIRAELFKEDLL